MSPTLGRPIALGLVERGASRIGETVTLQHLGRRLPARIAPRLRLRSQGRAPPCMTAASSGPVPPPKIFPPANVAISVVGGFRQTLVSGVRPLAAPFCAGLAPPVGFSGIARGPRYAVAVARDRLLVVSKDPIAAAEGFDAATATALTPWTTPGSILDLEGPGLADFVAKATSLDFSDASPSASLFFAGLTCIAYRYERPSRLRLHVERPLAAAFAQWAATDLICAVSRLREGRM